MSIHKVNGLEIDQDLEFQEREWKVERVAWGLLVLLLVMAVLGVFGTGWLSSAVARTEGDALVLDYERFIRHDGEASLEIRVDPGQVRDGQIELWIASDYLDDVMIQGVSPQPDEVRAEGNRHVFVFLSEQPDAPLRITVALSPERFGRYEGEMGLVDGPALSFGQLSYP